ncbi:MAG: cell envelope integrity protein TolA [Pseudomonadota bacterium]
MMRFGIQAGLISLSLLLHIWAIGGIWAINFTLVFLGLISPDAQREQSELVIVPIELVDLGEINNIAPIITRPEDPEPEVDEVPVEPEEDPPVEETLPEDPVDETLPEDDIEQTNPEAVAQEAIEEDVVPNLDAEPEPEVAEEDVDPGPKPRETQAVQRAQIDPLAGFLADAESTFQSERETRKRTPEPRPEPKSEPLLANNRPKPQTLRRGAGERTANTARLEALLYSYVEPCWSGVDDLPNPSQLNIRMRADLDETGNIINLRLVEPARRPIGRDPMGIAIDRGLRAVRKCAPYKLPRDDYSEWREIRINLGPAFEPS